MRLGLKPGIGRIDVVISNWRRIEGQIDVAWQSLHQLIVDASQGHRRISREERYLRPDGGGTVDPHVLVDAEKSGAPDVI